MPHQVRVVRHVLEHTHTNKKIFGAKNMHRIDQLSRQNKWEFPRSLAFSHAGSGRHANRSPFHSVHCHSSWNSTHICIRMIVLQDIQCQQANPYNVYNGPKSNDLCHPPFFIPFHSAGPSAGDITIFGWRQHGNKELGPSIAIGREYRGE